MVENPVSAFENFGFLFRNLRIGRENPVILTAELVFSTRQSVLTHAVFVLHINESRELGGTMVSVSHSFDFSKVRTVLVPKAG